MFARLMNVFGMTLQDIMGLSVAQYMLYVVEASAISQKQNEQKSFPQFPTQKGR